MVNVLATSLVVNRRSFSIFSRTSAKVLFVFVFEGHPQPWPSSMKIRLPLKRISQLSHNDLMKHLQKLIS